MQRPQARAGRDWPVAWWFLRQFGLLMPRPTDHATYEVSLVRSIPGALLLAASIVYVPAFYGAYQIRCLIIDHTGNFPIINWTELIAKYPIDYNNTDPKCYEDTKNLDNITFILLLFKDL